jgi:hypothetical protein
MLCARTTTYEPHTAAAVDAALLLLARFNTTTFQTQHNNN